jgi:hypothetical protein
MEVMGSMISLVDWLGVVTGVCFIGGSGVFISGLDS